MSKPKYLYGFRNKETGLFMPTYYTVRYKAKTCCFKTERNANDALRYQKNKDDYTVSIMAESE